MDLNIHNHISRRVNTYPVPPLGFRSGLHKTMASVEKTRFNAHRNTMFSKDLQKLLYFDTRNNVTGPIPTSDFVDTFLPTRHSPTPSSVPHTLSHEEAFVYSNDIVSNCVVALFYLSEISLHRSHH